MEDAFAFDLRTESKKRLDAGRWQKPCESFYGVACKNTPDHRRRRRNDTDGNKLKRSSIDSRLISLDASVLWKRVLPKM